MRFRLTLGLLWAFLLSPALAQVPQFPPTIAANSVLGRLGIGPGPVQAIPFAQLASQLTLSTCPNFTASTSGCVPASGGSALLFLNGAGAWTVPAGGGGGGTPATPTTGVQYNLVGSFAASPNFTFVDPTLTIGLAGSATGIISFAGGTSGSTSLMANTTASGTLTLPAATDTLIGKATTDTLTNKTYDTAGTGNSFKINGTAITAVSGNTAKVPLVTGAVTNAHCAQWDASGNLADSGGGCGGGGSTPGTPVNAVQFNSASTFGGSANFLWDGTGITLGVSGTLGYAKFGNASSGTVTLQPVTGALGTVTVSLPAATDTLVGRATADALTNKTSYNKVAITAPATSATLTIADGKTATHNSTTTFAGTDGKTVTFNNSITFTGTDGTTMTFPSASATITRTIASGALTLNTTAVSSAACGTAQTATATGTLTTDAIIISFNGDPTAVTGYVASTSGMLTIIPYPTADTLNVKVCNNTSASITPGAVTLNWRVVR